MTPGAGSPPAAERSPVRVSAVIVTYNSAHCVGACLASIVEQLQPHEIIVVDNASTDATIEAVHQAAPSSIVIESSSNLGFGRACNLAVTRATGDVVAFVNPDVSISRANLEELESDLRRAQLGLLVPLLSTTRGARPRHQIFPYLPWRWVLLRQTWSHFIPRELKRPARPARSTAEAWAAAALLFVRKGEFVELGGFDSRYFLYGEDLDLSRRYRSNGLDMHLTDSVVGHHSGAASSTSDDSLRIDPLGWSLLGTLEYLSHWSGDRVAARGAAMVLFNFRVERRLLGGMNRIPKLGRVARKLRQVERLEAFLLDHARAPDPGVSGHCRGARVALRTALGYRLES